MIVSSIAKLYLSACCSSFSTGKTNQPEDWCSSCFIRSNFVVKHPKGSELRSYSFQ